MTLYRRGSVTVEAITVTDILQRQPGAMPDWVQAAIDAGNIVVLADGLEVITTSGPVAATKKDWIIQRQTEHGELYVIPPGKKPGASFLDMYKPVE